MLKDLRRAARPRGCADGGRTGIRWRHERRLAPVPIWS